LQFLNITYSANLPSSSTLDDVRGTLEKFIPEGYYQSETEFLARVEEDASSFRPLGKKIHSYTRVALNSATKGKGAATTLPEGDPDAIVYEVWHVGGLAPCVLCPSPEVFSGNMEYPGVSRIPPADATVHPALHRGWVIHQR
jgi:hypothetical protein